MQLVWLPLLVLVSVSASAAEIIGLPEAYSSALKRSETISQQDELVIQAKEHESQATGSILPSVSGFGSYTVQDSGSTSSTLSPTTQPLVKLTANQPLFRGLREYAALRQTGKLTEAQEAQKKQAELQLYVDVANNYYAILSTEQDITNLKKESDLFGLRIKDVRSRTAIGRSRLGDALSIESAQASLIAQAEQGRAQLAVSRQNFAFLTGLPADTPLKVESGTAKLDSIDTYLGQIEARPDVQASRLRNDATEEGISIAKGAHLPSADLAGNYYFKRTGTNENVKWDVTASLSFPIYAGGTLSSRVNEAASQSRVAELDLARARRNADQEIRSIYQSVQSDQIALEAFARAKDLAQRNQETQARDYRFGLVTNLDVLQALVSLQEAERSLDRARFSARLNLARLSAATGQVGFAGK